MQFVVAIAIITIIQDKNSQQQQSGDKIGTCTTTITFVQTLEFCKQVISPHTLVFSVRLQQFLTYFNF